ncbi:MAG: cobyric acid synthase [Candidatus Omnitrophota bacterium]
MKTKTIQICGTGSDVGKSIIVAGLCRIFLQDGFRVAPFKAQNMALNSFVTTEGGEIGRAQATQAASCRLEPSVHMNPVLIKPTSDTAAQIIVRGKPVANMSALGYTVYKAKIQQKVRESFGKLKKAFEVIVIEGAGSPAEINLRRHDIANMKMARLAHAPVVLAGDIDKGGVFAQFVGTLELLTANERKRIKGFIINKFRGDETLLKPGIDFLEKKTKIPVLGVIPYFKDIKIPEEDSVVLERGTKTVAKHRKIKKAIHVAVIKLPYLSNFTDFDPLVNEPDVNLQYIGQDGSLNGFDLVIIPGSKNTVCDLLWMRAAGLTDKILSILKYQPATVVVGICGGYQILGEKIIDTGQTESMQKEIKGLGLLPIITSFKREKILSRVKATEISSGKEVLGYEIHHGRTEKLKRCKSCFKIIERNGNPVSELTGAITREGKVWGTYIHGIFDQDGFRRDFLNRLRQKKGWNLVSQGFNHNLDHELDKLARLVRENIKLARLYEILNGK